MTFQLLSEDARSDVGRPAAWVEPAAVARSAGCNNRALRIGSLTYAQPIMLGLIEANRQRGRLIAMAKRRPYRFIEIHSALHEHWGLSLRRGGATSDDAHDGRWDAAYSRTGFVVSGFIQRRGYGDYRYATLRSVVHAFELANAIECARRS